MGMPYGVEEAIAGDDGGAAPGPSGGGSNNNRGGNDPLPLPPLARASLFLQAICSDPDRFDARALPGLRAVSWSSSSSEGDGGSSSSSSSLGRLRCEIPFSRALTNRYGGMHGGCAASLVDVVSTAALAAVADRAGVSLSITTHYHRPVVPLPIAPAGRGGNDDGDGNYGGGGDSLLGQTVVVVDAAVVKVGKHVASAEVAIRTRPAAAARGAGAGGGDGEEEGPVLVSGTHVKALVARSDVGALFEGAGAAAAAAAVAGGPTRSRL